MLVVMILPCCNDNFILKNKIKEGACEKRESGKRGWCVSG